jgi:hypothetical protein
MYQLVRLAVFLLPALAVLCAQSPAPANQAELIEALLSRIDKLEKRVAELETRTGAPAAAMAAPAPVQHEAPAMPHDTMGGHGGGPPGDALATPTLHLAGFSDFNFAATDQRGARSGFSEGQFILHVSSALSTRVSYFGEISFTARPDVGTGAPAAGPFNVDIERSIIRFDQSDQLKVSFGRYHTPVNYWNTAYHHGSWLQTTISRPEMIQFGGSFIPVHFVGGLAEGALPAGGLNLNYNVGVGNGRGGILSRGGDFGDVNNNRAWLVNGFVKPDKLYGFEAGGAVYKDQIAIGAQKYDEWITSGHLVWNRETPELIAEAANVRHELPGRAATNSQAFYIQAAYRLPIGQKLWKPYYRYEYTHIPKSDFVFRNLPGLNGSTVGLRYDISSFAAFKLEYRSIARPGVPRYNGAFLQTSFTF